MALNISQIVEKEAKLQVTDLPDLVHKIKKDWWAHMIVQNEYIKYESDSFFRVK